MEQIRKAKTHKGKKIIRDKQAKSEEGVRKTLFIKGNKTSETVSHVMQ